MGTHKHCPPACLSLFLRERHRNKNRSNMSTGVDRWWAVPIWLAFVCPPQRSRAGRTGGQSPTSGGCTPPGTLRAPRFSLRSGGSACPPEVAPPRGRGKGGTLVRAAKRHGRSSAGSARCARSALRPPRSALVGQKAPTFIQMWAPQVAKLLLEPRGPFGMLFLLDLPPSGAAGRSCAGLLSKRALLSPPGTGASQRRGATQVPET